MKPRTWTLLLMGICFIAAGCAAPKSWISTPSDQTVDNSYFTATFTPLTAGKPYFNRFLLEITNRSSEALTVDWGASRYLYAGQPAGRYIHRGIQRENVNDPPPDVIAVGGQLRREIAPLRLIAWRGYKPGHKGAESFSAGPLPEGSNGILLVVRQNGREIRETLTVDIAVAP